MAYHRQRRSEKTIIIPWGEDGLLRIDTCGGGAHFGALLNEL